VKRHLLPLLMLLALGAGLAPAPSAAPPTRYLSGPTAGSPRAIARAHLHARRAELGLRQGDLDGAAERSFVTQRSGTTHVNLRQRVAGRDVVGGDLGLAVDRNGRVFGRWSRAVPDAASKTNAAQPTLDAHAALARAAEALELPAPTANPVVRIPGGRAREIVFAGGTVSRTEIPARLTYVPRNDALRLAWDLVIRTLDGQHWWHVHIDAVTGELLKQSDWVNHEGYRVYPVPLVSPDAGPRALVTAVADPIASPYGWHDTDGSAGAEFTDTRGNNVFAQEDVDADDSGGFRPDGGGGLVFDFPIDLSDQPSTHQAAVITNLFHSVNLAHDIFYRLGFDEASGNFQENNYGNGGSGLDAIGADAQDGGNTNNAQFATPPDGFAPEMEMYLWTGITHLEVTSPAGIAGFYPAAPALFGTSLTPSGISGTIVRAEDGTGVSTDACEALTNGAAISGNIALMDRGSCNFTVKVKNAQDAGAIAAVIVNNVGNETVTMSGTDASITIASLFIGQDHGAMIASETGSVAVTLSSGVHRDAALDNGVVFHEFAHGVTNRLTGGAANTSCLQVTQSKGMGEGWSDYFAISLTADPDDAAEDPRPIAAYLIGQSLEGPGIRTRSYSTDLAVDDLTLAHIATQGQPHGVGEVWASMLWEAHWELVHAYGFDPDLHAGTGGNNRALRLVVEGLKNQPCDPTFIEARDAILLAEMDETGGADECFLWRAFAKRGIGDGASVSTNPVLTTNTQSFLVPAQCTEFCADGTLQTGEECDDANRLDLDGCAATCETEFVQPFAGIAAGGSIEIVVEGVILPVTTVAGQTAAQVAANVAAAITGDPTLTSIGVVAQAVDDQVVTTGSIDTISISDSGLNPQVPVGPAVAPALLLGLLGLGLARLRRP